jgi:hypothetical protein
MVHNVALEVNAAGAGRAPRRIAFAACEQV